MYILCFIFCFILLSFVMRLCFFNRHIVNVFSWTLTLCWVTLSWEETFRAATYCWKGKTWGWETYETYGNWIVVCSDRNFSSVSVFKNRTKFYLWNRKIRLPRCCIKPNLTGVMFDCLYHCSLWQWVFVFHHLFFQLCWWIMSLDDDIVCF